MSLLMQLCVKAVRRDSVKAPAQSNSTILELPDDYSLERQTKGPGVFPGPFSMPYAALRLED